MKKKSAKPFEETFKPVWARTRELGLSKKDVDALIKEAIAKVRS